MLSLVAMSAVAQAPPSQLPGAAEPGRPAPERPPLPPPPIDLQWQIQVPPGAEPPRALRDEKLDLKDLVIEGVTAYRPEELRDLYAPLLGKEITFGDLYGISRAIQARYRQDGFVLSFAYIPPQTVAAGEYRIVVVEGFVDSVVVEDVDGALKRTLERVLAPLAQQRPLNTARLERQLLLANDLAGVKVTGVLQPSQKTRGAAELVAKVERKTFSGGASIDNRASEFTGRWQASADVAVDSVLGTGERLAVSATEANGFDELIAVSARYAQPIGADGLRLDAAATYSEAKPGFTLDPFDVETTSLNLDLEASYPVIRTRAETLSLGAGFTYRDTDVDMLNAGFNRDRIRLLRARIAYSRAGFLGGSSAATLRLAQALPVLNATDPDTDITSRADSQPTFTKGMVDLVHVQPLPAGFGLRLAATGQYARAPLPASEEFALGGARFGRAYNPAELTGEDGVAVSAEIGYDLALGLPVVTGLRPYGFYDFGKAWDERSSSSAGLAQSLSSAGFGLRAGLIHGGSLRLEYAYPLTRKPSNQSGEKDGRVFFFSAWRF